MNTNAIFNFLFSPGNLQIIISGAFTDSQWFEINGYEFWEQLNVGHNDISNVHKVALNLLHNGSVSIKDTEEDEIYSLNMDMIKQGWIKLICKYPKSYARIMSQEADMYDYDKLIQLSLFNKLIYG